MQLADELERARLREQAAAFDAAEAKIAAELAPHIPAPELSAEARQHLTAFATWAASVGVRAVPAKPLSVAAFVLAQIRQGVELVRILEQLSAIEALHDHYKLSNPAVTHPVRFALGRIVELPLPAPATWKKKEAEDVFPSLPLIAQEIILRRDREDREIVKKAFAERDRAKTQADRAGKKARAWKKAASNISNQRKEQTNGEARPDA